METRRKVLNCYRKGDGIRKISREFGIARNTVRDIIRSHKSGEAKGIKGELVIPSYVRKVQKYPTLENYISNLEKLLRDNKNARPKRTVMQKYEELCLQGFKGSYSSVNRYASKWKRLTDMVSPAACVPLSFAPGEAYQFDWSTDEVIINDEVISVKVAHFVLCYSGKKFGIFRWNGYSVDCSYAGLIVQCKAYADKIVFVCDGKEIGRHERRFTKGQTYYDYQHYLPILARKPGALRNGEPFINMDLPDELNKVRQILERTENGSRDFAHILSYIPVKSIESVINACAAALEMNAVSKDVILNTLFCKNDEEQDMKDIKDSAPEYLELKYIPAENCSSYDKLLSAVSVRESTISEVSL